MTTRPPLRYETPAQIVRLDAWGFNVPLPVLWYAQSQLPPIPVVTFEPIDWTEDDGSDTGLESNLDFGIWYRANKNADYDTRKDLAK